MELTEKWQKYYDNLDPMGKEFMDLLITTSDVSSKLFRFLVERGQLYACLIDIMNKANVDTFTVSLDELNDSKRWMIVFIPSEDSAEIIVTKKLYNEN